MCGGEKEKIQKGQQRVSAYPLSRFNMVCLCLSVCQNGLLFLSVRLLRLLLTFFGLAMWRKSKHKCSVLHKSSIEELPLNLALQPPYCQTDVSCGISCHNLIFRPSIFPLSVKLSNSFPSIIVQPSFFSLSSVNCSLLYSVK